MEHSLIKQGLDYMVEYDRIHTQKKDYSRDIKQLTIKTVIPEIMYYHEEKDFPLDELIFNRLAMEGVFTPSLTESQEKRIIEQLRIYYDIEITIPLYKNCQPMYDKKMTFSEFCKKTGD